MPVTKSQFDAGENITLFQLSNGTMKVNIIDYGASIQSIFFPDKNKVERDIVLGFDNLQGYKNAIYSSTNPYFGATIGRFANRIRNASFDLNGKHYQLAANNETNSLHGGGAGVAFDSKKWTLTEEGADFITLSYTSPHMEAGYPGKLVTDCKFTITHQNQLKLDYSAKLEGDEADATIVNLTNHTYFNLNGVYDKDSKQVLNHQVEMYSPNNVVFQNTVFGPGMYTLEVNNNLTLNPTGRLLSVRGTPFDFDGAAHTIGERMQEVKPFGYDHCYALETHPSKFRIDPEDVKKAVVVYSPLTGIRMTFSTGEPGFVFYTCGKMSVPYPPKKSQNDGSVPYGVFAGFNLQAQRYVDAINIKGWHNQVVLAKAQTYKQSTVYKFELAHQL